MQPKRIQVYEFGEFRLWPRTRLLERKETPVALNRRAFDVLLYLVQHPGRIVSKEELLKNVWDDAFVDENNLTQSISSLRRALNEKPGTNAFIATVPGKGYQFLSLVESRDEPGSAALAKDSHVDPETHGMLLLQRRVTTTVVTEQRRSLSARIMVAAGVLLVAGLAVGGILWERNHRVVPGDHHEVVLADFQNTTGEADFSEPLKTAIAIDLRQSPYLSVA
jgi:eukaryotic-like serine/threonine-protein kinase